MKLPTPGIPRWRLALSGGVVVVLAAVGVGLVSAAPWASAPQSSSAPAADSADPVVDQLVSPSADGQTLPVGLARRFIGRHLVHAVATFDRPGKGLVTVQLDHGTLGAIGNGSVTVVEAGGASVTVRTDTATRVRKDRQRVQLSDLRAGDQVYVASLVQAGQSQALAKLIVVPAAAKVGANPASPAGSPQAGASSQTQ
ncbi:MAG: hypothetical protein ACXWMX_01025 [Candidatus Limnocylindrales bacterium]